MQDIKEMSMATYTPLVSPVVVSPKPRNICKISNKAAKASPEEAQAD